MIHPSSGPSVQELENIEAQEESELANSARPERHVLGEEGIVPGESTQNSTHKSPCSPLRGFKPGQCEPLPPSTVGRFSWIHTSYQNCLNWIKFDFIYSSLAVKILEAWPDPWIIRGARRCFPARTANGPPACSCWPKGACARAHYSDSAICTSWICSRAGRPCGGRLQSLFPRAEHLLRPGDQQWGSQQRGRVSKHGGGTPRKREKGFTLVFFLPLSEHTFNWSFLFGTVPCAFHIQYPPHVYLFVYF